MTNPWMGLPETPPYVLKEDLRKLRELGLNVRTSASGDHGAGIHVHVLPVPYLGPTVAKARVCLLNLNPSYKECVKGDERNPLFIEELRRNLNHKSTYPFWPLDPRLDFSAGACWWSKRLRLLIADICKKCSLSDKEARLLLADRLLCLQWFPYHSPGSSDLGHPKRSLLVPSQNHTFQLVHEAISRGIMIIMLRSKREWTTSVPELTGHFVELNNPRALYITPGNMPHGEYERMLKRLVR